MNKRDLSFYVSVGELVSAIAIVISLLYATWEFRRSDQLNSSEVNALLYERGFQMDQLIIENPQFAGILVKLNNDELLSEVERFQYLAYQASFYDQWELAWDYHQQGILDDDTWSSWNDYFENEARKRPVWSWVENRQNYTTLDFRHYVDTRLGYKP